MNEGEILQFLHSKLHKLHREGGQWKAICPEHDDHHPSLSISLKKGVFNCLTCGFSGTVNQLLQKLGSNELKYTPPAYVEPRRDTEHYLARDILYYSTPPDLDYWKTRMITSKSLEIVDVKQISLDRIKSINLQYGMGLQKRFPDDDRAHIFPVYKDKKIVGGILYFINAHPHYWTIARSNLSTSLFDCSRGLSWAFVVEGEVDLLSVIELGFPVIGIYNAHPGEDKIRAFPPNIKKVCVMLDNPKTDKASRGYNLRRVKDGYVSYQTVKGATKECLRKFREHRPDIQLAYYEYPDADCKDANDLLVSGKGIDIKQIRRWN